MGRTSPQVIKLLIDRGLISTVEDVEFWLCHCIGTAAPEAKAEYAAQKEKAKMFGQELDVEVNLGEARDAARKVARKLAQEATGEKIEKGKPYPPGIKAWLAKHAGFLRTYNIRKYGTPCR